MKKYKLTDEAIKYNCVTLYRIEALRNFGSIKAGDKGGFVQSYHNLSQEGDCWIHGEAKVFGNAKVYENAQVFGSAGKNTDGDVLFYGPGRHKYTWRQVLPLSKATERLVGTTKSYEELIQELDAESIKKGQQ